MKILLASSNEHKKKELESLLKEHVLILPKELGLSFNCDETGLTYRENALQKAQALWNVAREKEVHLPVLADDSGLDVDALPGELGIHTARYGSKEGEPLLSAEEKNRLLLEALKGLPDEKRTARFTCCLTVIMPDGRIIEAQETVEGRILHEAVGTQGFGYDPVFYNNEAKGSFALLGTEEKNKFGHRGKAAEKLRKMLYAIIPEREAVPEKDKWDLSDLFTSKKLWEEELNSLKTEIKEAENFRGHLGDSSKALLDFLKWESEVSLKVETVCHYAQLMYYAETDNPDNQRMAGLSSMLATDFFASISFADPEILQIKDVENLIKAKAFDDYRVALNKVLRMKAHTLSSDKEELLARQSELQETPSEAFEVLTNADMDFGEIEGKKLTQSSLSQFLHSNDRSLRERAYKQFYSEFEGHQQVLAKLYAGSVKQDIFNARTRGFATALDKALFSDDVNKSVYTGLIEAVHKGLPALHRYYSLRKSLMGLSELRHYDVYVPLVASVKTDTTYEKACEIIQEALSPLGKEYTDRIYQGLTSDRWVDRYENKGKRSGAFSSGGFIGNPYILINYKTDVLDSVFTLAHEGGHSMHSWYSRANNPYPCYDYTIFEAEVASTFNEQLLSEWFIKNADSQDMKRFIIAKRLDDMVATLFRQTMFAEYELICHTSQEEGTPLTIESLRKTYRDLLEAYFGPEMVFEENSDLEGLRIPHFYSAFYVYKYATGISASIALSQKVLNGDKQDLEAYLSFLKSGGSRFPIDSLKLAGVEMSTQDPVNAAVAKFTELLDEFEKLTIK